MSERRKICSFWISATLLTAFTLLLFPFQMIFDHFPVTGDALGHFQTFSNWIHYGLPNLQLRFWNPTNAFGEINLLSYFPFPLFIMAGFSILFPVHVAFNIGLILPLFLFPICTMWMLLQFNWSRFNSFATSACCLTLFYGAKNYFGGNAYGTLVGMFSHTYALCALFLFLGAFYGYLNGKRSFILPTLFAAIVVTSHALIAFWIPVLTLLLIFGSRGGYKNAIKKSIFMGIASLLLTAFFTIPFISNLPWTFRVAFIQDLPPFYEDSMLPMPIFLVFFVTFLLSCWFLIRKPKSMLNAIQINWFWFSGIAGSLLIYAFLVKTEQTAMRVVSQVQYFLTIAALGFVFSLLGQFPKKISAIAASLILSASLFYVIQKHDTSLFTEQFGPITESKDFEVLKDFLEHHSNPTTRVDTHFPFDNKKESNPRVFDTLLLPYFAKRPTATTLYIEGTHTNAYWILLKNLMASIKLCYKNRMDCELGHSVEQLPLYMRFLGLNQFIFMDKSLSESAKKLKSLHLDFHTEDTQIFSLTEKTSLVDVIEQEKITIENGFDNFQNKFMEAFKQNVENQSYLLLSSENLTLDDTAQVCNPNLTVNFNKMILITDCPDKLHRIKFSYHPALITDTRTSLHLISPGFIAIKPSSVETMIFFHEPFLWRIANWISIISFLFVCVILIKRHCFKI